ncbi:MAG: putative Histidine kinase [Promethearchaeota archaeon]|nr:MAG: putative Histidine kinase [Candidatus Lokiarchaeota archaeon]
MANLNNQSKEQYIKKLEALNKEFEYKNTLLQIQNAISKLVMLKEDTKELIKEACNLLSSNQIFRLSFVLLYDSKQNLHIIKCFQAKEQFFGELEKALKDAYIPKCISKALDSKESKIIENDSKLCKTCNLKKYKTNELVKITSLEYNQNCYGFLFTYIKENGYNFNRIAQKLDEISEELAYGIYNINSEKEKIIYAKNLEKSEKKYRLLSNSAKDLIYAHDLDGKIIYANEAMLNFVDLKRKELIGQNVFDLTPNKEKESMLKRSNLRHSGNKSHLIYEIVAKKPNGEKIPLEVNSVPIMENGEIIGIHCVARDISERKEAEKALKKSKQEYQNAFNRAEFYKDLFAHDIRNILQGMLTGLQLIEFQLKQNINQSETIENLGTVKDQIERGQRLVLNIKKLSQITHDDLGLKSMEILPILNECVNNIKKIFTKRPMTIKINCENEEIRIKANELLGDLFENLIINSIKHNNNEHIEIMINISEIEQKQQKFIRFEFIDNAMGIKDSRKEILFQRAYFKRKKHEGLGLGLSLVKRIIDLYRGKIWVENRVKEDHSKGSKFIFEIPKF